MAKQFIFAGILTAVVLVGCSGGEDSPTNASSLQSSSLPYPRTASTFVSITSLNLSIRFAVSNWTGFTPTTRRNLLYLA